MLHRKEKKKKPNNNLSELYLQMEEELQGGSPDNEDETVSEMKKSKMKIAFDFQTDDNEKIELTKQPEKRIELFPHSKPTFAKVLTSYNITKNTIRPKITTTNSTQCTADLSKELYNFVTQVLQKKGVEEHYVKDYDNDKLLEIIEFLLEHTHHYSVSEYCFKIFVILLKYLDNPKLLGEITARIPSNFSRKNVGEKDPEEWRIKIIDLMNYCKLEDIIPDYDYEGINVLFKYLTKVCKRLEVKYKVALKVPKHRHPWVKKDTEEVIGPPKKVVGLSLSEGFDCGSVQQIGRTMMANPPSLPTEPTRENISKLIEIILKYPFNIETARRTVPEHHHKLVSQETREEFLVVSFPVKVKIDNALQNHVEKTPEKYKFFKLTDAIDYSETRNEFVVARHTHLLMSNALLGKGMKRFCKFGNGKKGVGFYPRSSINPEDDFIEIEKKEKI